MGPIGVAVAVVAGAVGFLVGRSNHPPQPFDDKVTLPGKAPGTAKDLSGAWFFNYRLSDAALESGKANLISLTILNLNEDGTYRLQYSARWNLSAGPLSGVTRKVTMDGRNVVETGRYSLSGEVLLLEPSSTEYWDVENNTLVNHQSIRNENRPLIVALEKRRLSVAGRCAAWQVDPICREAPANWYAMQRQIGGGRPDRTRD